MPTRMPGKSSDEIYVAPTQFKELAQNFEDPKLSIGFNTVLEQELKRLGDYLVPEVKRRTPKTTGRLARSTHNRVVKRRLEGTGDIQYELHILQDATSIPNAKVSNRYFYWYTVHHGLKPAGRLKQVFAPYEALVPWVIRKLGTTQAKAKQVARSVAWKIYKEGIPPNPYLQDSIDDNLSAIQDTANRIGYAISLDLVRLPNIVMEQDEVLPYMTPDGG